MKTLPEILAITNARIVLQVTGNLALKDSGVDFTTNRTLNEERADQHHALLEEAQEAIAKELMGCLPERQYNDLLKLKKMTPWQRSKARALVKGRNNTIDDVRARLTAFIGKGKDNND